MKKILAMVLALAMMFALAVSASAYETEVVYEKTLNQEIDVDEDGTNDGTITEETPYLLVVPEELTVDGAAGTVYIAGISPVDVTATADATVTLTDTDGNDLDADVNFDGVTLPTSVTEEARANAPIDVDWQTAPLTGEWNGVFNYTVA